MLLHRDSKDDSSVFGFWPKPWGGGSKFHSSSNNVIVIYYFAVNKGRLLMAFYSDNGRTSNLCLIAGLLAVGGTDGLVKVFCLKVLPSISGVAQYVLWGDKDDLQVQWLNWLHSPQVC